MISRVLTRSSQSARLPAAGGRFTITRPPIFGFHPERDGSASLVPQAAYAMGTALARARSLQAPQRRGERCHEAFAMAELPGRSTAIGNPAGGTDNAGERRRLLLGAVSRLRWPTPNALRSVGAARL